MIAVEQILDKIGIRLADELRNAIKTKLLTRQSVSRGRFQSVANASGKLIDSVEYKVEGARLTISAWDYIYYLEKGRGPTKGGGNGSLRQIIRQWIDDKGITPDGISKDSLAYLITRRIHEEGTTIYQAGGSDLVSSIFNEQLVNSIEAEFANLIAAEVSSEIVDIAA